MVENSWKTRGNFSKSLTRVCSKQVVGQNHRFFLGEDPGHFFTNGYTPEV